MRGGEPIARLFSVAEHLIPLVAGELQEGVALAKMIGLSVALALVNNIGIRVVSAATAKGLVWAKSAA